MKITDGSTVHQLVTPPVNGCSFTFSWKGINLYCTLLPMVILNELPIKIVRPMHSNCNIDDPAISRTQRVVRWRASVSWQILLCSVGLSTSLPRPLPVPSTPWRKYRRMHVNDDRRLSSVKFGFASRGCNGRSSLRCLRNTSGNLLYITKQPSRTRASRRSLLLFRYHYNLIVR